jgi:hypothetical protein
MAKRPPTRLLLIVTGSTLRAEEKDRPLAYYLKQRIEGFLRDGANHSSTDSNSNQEWPDDRELAPGSFEIRVVADFRWIHDDLLQGIPTISLGGPGVNALAHRWLEEVPVSLAVGDRYFIQMDPDIDEPRVSIWGMDNVTTQIAISVFADRFLARFLEKCAAMPPTSIESGQDDEDEEMEDLESQDDEDDDVI